MIPASATKASSKELNILVERVEKPRGEIRRVMGSSFIVERITSPAAAPKPGAMMGKSIRRSRETRLAPKIFPASCNRLGT